MDGSRMLRWKVQYQTRSRSPVPVVLGRLSTTVYMKLLLCPTQDPDHPICCLSFLCFALLSFLVYFFSELIYLFSAMLPLGYKTWGYVCFLHMLARALFLLIYLGR